MGERAALGYIGLDGLFMGTGIQWGGSDLMDRAVKRFEAEGYWSLYRWIREGIAGGGYENFEDTEPEGVSSEAVGADGGLEVLGAGHYFDHPLGDIAAAVVVTPYGVRSIEEHFYRRWERERVRDAATDEAWDRFPNSTQGRERANHIMMAARDRLAHDAESRDSVVRRAAAEWNLKLDRREVTDDSQYMDMPFPPELVPEGLGRLGGYVWYRQLDSDVPCPMWAGRLDSSALALHAHPEMREQAAASRDLPAELLTVLTKDSDAVVRVVARRNQGKRSQGTASR